ncbi:MFS transporter [Paraburkholderia sediminicola]|uniref:MFS transporter n=1 Tax=Paraburkholderia sediminicola TaxID=458836 RepID=UPI0038B8DFCF
MHEPRVAVIAVKESLRNTSGSVYAGWLTVMASIIGLALGPSTLLVFCFGTFVTPLSHAFGWSVASISVGATILTIMSTVTSVLQGQLVDRFGGRRLALISIPAMSLGVAALSLLPASLAMFYAACVIIPLAAVGTWPISYLQITASWFKQRLGLAMGLANTGIGIGAACLPPLATYLISHAGWRSTYAWLGAGAFVLTWPVAIRFLRENRRAQVSAGEKGYRPERRELSRTAFLPACRTRAFGLLLLAFLLLGPASATAIVHQSRVLLDLGMSAARVGWVQGLMGGALIIGRLATGWLLDRVSPSVVMTACCLAASAAFALLALGAPYGTAYASAVVIGFVVGAEFDVLSVVVARYFGTAAFGTIYGTIFAAFQVSSAVSMTLVGMARVHSGSYAPALWVVTATTMACALCFVMLHHARFPSAEVQRGQTKAAIQ